MIFSDTASDLPPAALRRGFRPMNLPPPFVPPGGQAASVPPSPSRTAQNKGAPAGFEFYRSAPASPSSTGKPASELAGWRSQSMGRLTDQGSYAAGDVLDSVRSKLQEQHSRQAEGAAPAEASLEGIIDPGGPFCQLQSSLSAVHLAGKQAATSSAALQNPAAAEPHSPGAVRVDSLTRDWPASPVKISAKKNLTAAPSRLQGSSTQQASASEKILQGARTRSLEFPNLIAEPAAAPLISPELRSLNYTSPLAPSCPAQQVISAQVPSAPELENSQSFVSDEGYRSEEGSDYDCSSADMSCDVSLNTSHKSGLAGMIASARGFGSVCPSYSCLSEMGLDNPSQALSRRASDTCSALETPEEEPSFILPGDMDESWDREDQLAAGAIEERDPVVEALLKMLSARQLSPVPPGATPMAREPPLFQVRGPLASRDVAEPGHRTKQQYVDGRDALLRKVSELESENLQLRRQLQALGRSPVVPSATRSP